MSVNWVGASQAAAALKTLGLRRMRVSAPVPPHMLAALTRLGYHAAAAA